MISVPMGTVSFHAASTNWVILLSSKGTQLCLAVSPSRRVKLREKVSGSMLRIRFVTRRPQTSGKVVLFGGTGKHVVVSTALPWSVGVWQRNTGNHKSGLRADSQWHPLYPILRLGPHHRAQVGSHLLVITIAKHFNQSLSGLSGNYAA